MDSLNNIKSRKEKNEVLSEYLFKKFFMDIPLLSAFKSSFYHFVVRSVIYFSKPLTREEAENYVKEISGGKVKYEESTSTNGHLTYESKNPTIVLNPNCRLRGIIAHELGHYKSGLKRGTYNKSQNISKKGHRVTTYGSELEAWEEAEKLTKNDIMFKALKKASLNSYKYKSEVLLQDKSLGEDKLRTFKENIDIKFTLISVILSSIIYKFSEEMNNNSFKSSVFSMVGFLVTSYLMRQGLWKIKKSEFIKN